GERPLGQALDAHEPLHPLAHAVDVGEPCPHPLRRRGDRELDLTGERHRGSLRAGTIHAGPRPARKALPAERRADNRPAMPRKVLLQVALDYVDNSRALKCAREAVAGGADVLKVGTPLLKAEGLEAVRMLRKEFGKVPIVCDAKTMDAGRAEVE